LFCVLLSASIRLSLSLSRKNPWLSLNCESLHHSIPLLYLRLYFFSWISLSASYMYMYILHGVHILSISKVDLHPTLLS
jgi:hypothetical protein